MAFCADNPNEEDFSRLFRLLAAASEEARQLQLADLHRLIEMSLLRVTVDWEGVDPEAVAEAELRCMLNARVRQMSRESCDNVVSLAATK